MTTNAVARRKLSPLDQASHVLLPPHARFWEGVRPKCRERHVEAHHTGVLMEADTSKLPQAAAHVLNEDVLPLFEAHGAGIRTVLMAYHRLWTELLPRFGRGNRPVHALVKPYRAPRFTIPSDTCCHNGRRPRECPWPPPCCDRAQKRCCRRAESGAP